MSDFEIKAIGILLPVSFYGAFFGAAGLVVSAVWGIDDLWRISQTVTGLCSLFFGMGVALAILFHDKINAYTKGKEAKK